MTKAPWGNEIVPGRRVVVVDIDGTICTKVEGDAYHLAEPILHRIAELRRMREEEGWYIVMLTARGGTTGKNWRPLTEMQLRKWRVPYDELHLRKPHYDRWIDDKAENACVLDARALSAPSADNTE